MNLLFAIPAAIAAFRLLENVGHPDRPSWTSRRHVATSGLFALVYGFSNSETTMVDPPGDDRDARRSLWLWGAFVAIEKRVEHPLLPLRVLADRTRGGSFLAIGISGGIAMFAVFLVLMIYLQQTKGFSPIETGLAFLPMTAAIMITATSVNIRYLVKVGPRPLLTRPAWPSERSRWSSSPSS